MSEKIEIHFKKASYNQLTEKDRQLVDRSVEAMGHAHAPYSKFKVGSAVRLSDDQVVTGNNQENAAYPSGLCAERVALFKAKADSDKAINSVAVVATNASGHPADAFCCGSCRQVMMEYAGLQSAPIRIIMRDQKGGFILLEDLRMLLPFQFNSDNLVE